MAFVTSPQVSSLAVELLSRDVVLTGTVNSVDPSEFNGSNGDEIIIRVPATRTARLHTPGTPITLDAVVETPVTLSVAEIYDGAPLEDYQTTLEIEDFGRQVLEPQVESITARVEATLAAAMNGIAADNDTETDVDAAMTEAWRVLTQNNVPQSGRYAAVDPVFAQALLRSDLLRRNDQSGSTGALRDATIGNYRGFTVVVSNALDSGEAELGRVVAYHRSGFAFTVKPAAPARGAAESSVASASGISMRHIFDYDSTLLRDRSIMATFVGAVLVDADRVYVVELAEAPEVPLD